MEVTAGHQTTVITGEVRKACKVTVIQQGGRNPALLFLICKE